MSRVCKITGKKTLSGNNRSHSMNATRRVFFPNLQIHRIWSKKKNRFVKMRISKKGMKIIDKKGIDNFIK